MPIESEKDGRDFEGLRHRGGVLSSQAAQLAVLSLAQAVVVLLPLGGKGLVVLAEKALLSRVLLQIEKQREALE
ncbi:hypothetical protein OFC18_32540, partial [Escherichia coli]|nr:hypothetical protein [Escherichia coli]